MLKRFAYKISGSVQGVGFRPFIYTIADELGIDGFVKNTSEGVLVEVQAKLELITKFEAILNSNRLPPLAEIVSQEKIELKPLKERGFSIINSTNTKSSKTALVIPDVAICSDCLRDTQDRKNQKYYNYFATSCTNCGPRYSFINTTPYDRQKTSMSEFEMCPSCKEAYRDPKNRRYHAQSISCNNCGPTLTGSIELAMEYIKKGSIVAIKGLGGFHLVCDARDDEAIKKLREHKNRATKPLAIMCKDIAQVDSLAFVDKKERELLSSKEAPIVVLRKKQNSKISKLIAPNIDRVGCVLAYTSLHHLLFKSLSSPIVATSANLSFEPIIRDANYLKERLSFVEYVLDFDREIVNAVDDSLVQVVDAKVQTLRLARGYAPKVIKLPFKSKKKILAVGANAKNTIAFVIEDSIIISPHIGDLDSLVAFEFFKRTLDTFKSFYDFEPDIIVHDKHPQYYSSKWAKEQDSELIEVQHHLAHIYACKAEFALSGEYLGFSFDGTGYGDDGKIWGGEVFIGDRRVYSFKSIKLLGGQKAIKEPRKVALSMLFDKYSLEEVLEFELAFSKAEIKLLHQVYTKELNAPSSSSVARLFEGVASLLDLVQISGYEGEAGLMCERAYNKKIKESFEFRIEDGIIDIEFDFFDKELLSKFINTLADIVLEISKKYSLDVVLSGGVFQNKTLLELIAKRLKEAEINYYHQEKTPINDGGISLGQAYYALMNYQ